MSEQSKPTIVRTFMTHEMSDADIVALSTAREAEFAKIMAAIGRSRRATPGNLQHVVLYGSRGFGKSFMMRRVEIELQKQHTENRPVRFLLLPEEQHNLQKSPHAFLDYISVLLSRRESDAAFADAMFQWPKPGEAARRWAASAAALEAALDGELPGGDGLVIVAVENFDSLLASLFADDEDEQRLRDWLYRRNNRVMLLATATGTVDMEYDRPLFHAFESVRLTPWTNDDCIDYFNRKRETEGRPPLEPRQEAKARAVAEFIGGTPRLAQLLAEVIDTEDALTVAQTMNSLADRLAEYYRRRIEDLAPLVRGLLDALIRGGEPASQTQLAERVGAEGQSQIARAMTDLQKADIIRGHRALDSRETLYAVTDRVFAHYYRRRQGSRATEATPLAAILDFLRSFYSREEQKQQGLRHLLEGRLAEGALFSRLAMEGASGGHDAYSAAFESRLSVWLSAATRNFGSAKNWEEKLAREPELVLRECQATSDDAPVDAVILSSLRAQALHRLGHDEQVETELRGALELAGQDIPACIVVVDNILTFYSSFRRDNLKAVHLASAVATLSIVDLPQPLKIRGYLAIGWVLGERGRNEEAVEQLAKGISLAREIGDKREEARALQYSGWSYSELGRDDEAVTQLERAFHLTRTTGSMVAEAQILCMLGWSLGQVGRHDEAVTRLAEAIRLSTETKDMRVAATARIYSGWSLNELSRYEEAFVLLEQAVAIARETADGFDLFAAISAMVDTARHVPVRGIASYFRDWVYAFRNLPTTRYPDPRDSVTAFLISVIRAGELEAYDDVIAKNGKWLTSERIVLFQQSDGVILADIAAKGGRSAGWRAFSDLLHRAAHLQSLAPEDNRDVTWLSDIVAGFAKSCHDPGLLRDVADLLTPDLSPEAEQSATLLRDLAKIDEANDPERVLDRMDPDRALLIRRLRGLPDPEPARPAKTSRRKRR